MHKNKEKVANQPYCSKQMLAQGKTLQGIARDLLMQIGHPAQNTCISI